MLFARRAVRRLSVAARVSAGIKDGILFQDERQQVAAAQLDRCLSRFRKYAQRKAAGTVPPIADAFKVDQHPPVQMAPTIPMPKGLYLHGCVGTGKSMLMDMFHEAAQQSLLADGSALPTRRVHFNAFMSEAHGRVHAVKQGLLRTLGRDVNIKLTPERDVITTVANHIADEAALLCFDEFQVMRCGCVRVLVVVRGITDSPWTVAMHAVDVCVCVLVRSRISWTR